MLWGCDAVETDEPDPLSGGTGHLWKNAAKIPLTIDNEMIWRCPRRPLLDDPAYWSKLLFSYSLFRDGHMIDEGSVSSQSFKAMTLFGIIQDAMAAVETEKAERAALQAARRG